MCVVIDHVKNVRVWGAIISASAASSHVSRRPHLEAIHAPERLPFAHGG